MYFVEYIGIIVSMSLWVDKYRPKSLSKLDFHLDQAENLKKLVKKGDFPHLLVYGPSGAGKYFKCLDQCIYLVS